MVAAPPVAMTMTLARTDRETGRYGTSSAVTPAGSPWFVEDDVECADVLEFARFEAEHLIP